MSRSFFLDLEASDSEEEGEESSLSEVSSVERSRQLSERVPLRKPDEPCALDAVISKWETIGENARDHTENLSNRKRKRPASSPSPPPEESNPAPAFEWVDAEREDGSIVTLQLPIVINERELERESRIADILDARDKICLKDEVRALLSQRSSSTIHPPTYSTAEQPSPNVSDPALVAPSALSPTPPAIPVSGTALADLDAYSDSEEQSIAESRPQQARVDV